MNLESVGKKIDDIDVTISSRIIELFSAGLYSSPNKAFEELICNSYDAFASKVAVYSPDDPTVSNAYIWVCDNGEGLNAGELKQLWKIGESLKRMDKERDKKRLQIGQFGIGKLSTYILARKLTYISKKDERYILATMDYNLINNDVNGIKIDEREVTEEEVKQIADEYIKSELLNFELFGEKASKTWTISLLTELKPKASEIKLGRLKWLLSTALPLNPGFELKFNGAEVESSKVKTPIMKKWIIGKEDETLDKIDGAISRVEKDADGEDKYFVDLQNLRGINGEFVLYEDSLVDGKSSYLGRSHGIFLSIRGRLINLDDPLLGMEAFSHGAFNRTRIIINADELCTRLAQSIPGEIAVIRLVPARKDWNDVLRQQGDIPSRKFIAETITLRELPTAQPVPMLRMADVELTSVDWLWFPYIPFGKLTIIQGNPGEGKTYFAMRLAAACTNRKPLPGMETLEPFNIIYQTAEDGLGDTVKPRLMEADADLERVLVIDDRDTPLTLADERIARAIRENNARLVIIDPVQAFLGADVDMNRANEVRPIFRSLGDIAQATGCAIVLIGHLNKAAGTQSTYRGLGSIDITAAVRSLLFIGKLRDSPTTRVLIHEKSSLAPPGQSLAFSLGDEKGFEWIGAYDITADELLAGTDTAKTESKTAQAQMLILELLANGKRMPSAELEKAVNERGISSRTMRTAKSRIGDRLVTEKDSTAWVCYLRD